MVKLLVSSGFARDCDYSFLVLLVRDAVTRQDTELLTSLTRHSDAELDYKSLRYACGSRSMVIRQVHVHISCAALAYCASMCMQTSTLVLTW